MPTGDLLPLQICRLWPPWKMRILGSGKQHWFSPHFYTHLTRLTFQTLNILHGGTAASQGSVPRSKRGDVAGRRWLPPASLIQVQLSTGPRVEAEIAAEDQGRMQPSALHLGPLAKARVARSRWPCWSDSLLSKECWSHGEPRGGVVLPSRLCQFMRDQLLSSRGLL